MKIVKIVIISLVSFIIILVLGAVIFVKTFDVNRYKPQIVAEAGKALGRRIDFQKANLAISLRQGLSLKVSGFSISEDPAFGKEDFVSVKNISAGVDVLGYLTQKKISVTSILIDSPRVSIIRLKDGSINAQTIAKPAEAGKEIVKSSPAAAAVAIPAILVSSIKADNATAVYLDKSFSPPFRLEVKNISVTISNISVNPEAQGQVSLAADLALENADMQLKEIASPVRNIKAQVKVRGNDVILEKASLDIAGGSIAASGSLKDYLVKQDYSASADIKDLKLQELISQENSPAKIEGIASGSVKIKGEGFTPEALRSSLSGNADISVAKAQIKGLNVLRAVLDKISVIPGLSSTVESGLPDKYKQKLAQNDTQLNDIKLPLTIENGRVAASDISIGADEFLFKGSGLAHLSGAFSLEGSFFIPADLSAAMVGQVSQLQYLLDQDKRIYIPLKVSGKAGETKFNLDSQYIAEKLIANQAKQQLFKVLEKAAGGSSDQNSQGQQDPNGQSSSGEAVGNLLRGLFKK